MVTLWIQAALLFSATLSPMAYARHSQAMTSGPVRRGGLDMSHLLLVAFDLAVILVDGAKTLVKYGGVSQAAVAWQAAEDGEEETSLRLQALASGSWDVAGGGFFYW
ncbi:hypothetical protein HaLaN_12339 [Haematococcus lacustris]|uniref:Uncharacterized protein n=1 Tax=Haematococcus lacustris TaxID=44745 RepID=A0A699ZA53_HAELA|nr:hypothetical protein HaLaN_12339 [Haematococcus lacustris]